MSGTLLRARSLRAQTSKGDTAATNTSYPFFKAAALSSTPLSLAEWQAAPPEGSGQDQNSKFLAAPTPPPSCDLPAPDAPDFWAVVNPHDGVAPVIPKAGGAPLDVSVSAVGLINYTGTITFSLDTTQSGTGAALSGLTATFNPASVTVTAGSIPIPVVTILKIASTSSVADGTYPVTVVATDSESKTKTIGFNLQIGAPTKLAFVGPTGIKAGSCTEYEIHTVDKNGNPSDVLTQTFLSATGIGKGDFYQDHDCTTKVQLGPGTPACPAGIVIQKGQFAPGYSGTHSIWFMDLAV